MPRKTRNLHLVGTALLTPKVYLKEPFYSSGIDKNQEAVPIIDVGASKNVTVRNIEDLEDEARIGMIRAQYQANSKLMQQAFCQRLCCAGLIGGALAIGGAGR